MKQYNVTGMSCAACSARVEKAVSKLLGVENCSVSLLTNSMAVEGNVAPEDVIRAVEEAGYGACEKIAGGSCQAGSKSTDSYISDMQAAEDALSDKETPLLS